MPRIIKHDRVVEDDWQALTLAAGETPATVTLPADPVLLPLPVWLARRAEISSLYPTLGVWLDSHEGPEALADDIDRLSIIAVNFPKFVDGRGYSTASLLRQRYGYTGELRAVGDILHDQLFYLTRVGFDAYALRDDKSAAYAIEKGFSVFSDAYQPSTTQPQPLFRRRSA